MKKSIQFISTVSWYIAVMCTGFSYSHAQEKTLQDVRRELYGEDFRNPSPQSRVGRYLQETGASFVVRSFPNSPEGNEIPPHQQGPEKLVIAVSPETFDRFNEIFSTENILFHLYEPEDVRTVVGYKGKRGTEGMLLDQMAYTLEGTLVSSILLDSVEAQNLTEYFKLAEYDARVAANPWRLQNDAGELYSAMMGFEFQGCSHWFGLMPIGRNLVNAYGFPSSVNDPYGLNPNQKPLTTYSLNWYHPTVAAQIQKVWTIPGKQQFGVMLNEGAFNRGELANAGWITYTLLASVGTDRIPVVFLMVNDEKQLLSPNFPIQIHAN